MYTYILT